MKQLKDFAIEAHGGLDRWRQFEQVSADLIQGGALWSLKGQALTLEQAIAYALDPSSGHSESERPLAIGYNT